MALPDRIIALMDLPHAVLFWDQNLRCIASNSNSSDNFTAYRGDFLKGSELRKLPAKQGSIDHWITLFDKAKSTLLPIEFTEPQTINGQSLELQTTIIPELVDNQIIGYSTITIQLSRNTASQHLDLAWQNMFVHSGDIAMALDCELRVRKINKDWLERSAEWFIGLNFLNFIDESGRETLSSMMPHVCNQFESFRMDVKISLCENCWYSLQVLPWVENNVVNSIIVVLRDITAVKRMELEKSDISELLHDAFKSSDIATVLLRTNGSVIAVNNAAISILSDKFSHLDQLHLHFANRLRSIDHDTPVRVGDLKVFNACSSKKSARERIAIKQNNEWLPFESIIQLVDSGEKETTNMIWTLKNVQNDMLRIERLKRINDKLDSFVQTAAHDIKAPVSNIYNLSLILKRSEDKQTKMVVVDKLVAASNQLSEQVKDLLDLSELRRNKRLQTEDLDLQSVLNQILIGFESQLQDGEVTVLADFNKAPSIHFNKAFMVSILNNLIGNAIKYASPNRPSMVSVASRPAVNGLWLEVSDNGIGIDLIKHGKDLFLPYRRLTTEGYGKGLGLSFVKDFVDKVGGEILVDSTPDIGTTFSLLLHNMNPDTSQYSLFQELDLENS